MGPFRVFVVTLAFVETNVPVRPEGAPPKRIDAKLVTFEFEAYLALLFIIMKPFLECHH